MATVLELADRGLLLKLDPHLEPNEQEWRCIYILPRVAPRFQNDLPAWESIWKVEQSPIRQMDALLDVFCGGATLTFDHQFKPLHHIQHGVWELKTADLRLFGWFAQRDCFIGSALDMANNVKNHGLYPGYIGEAVRLREQLDLDNPKFVPGDDPHAVITNYDFP